LSRKVDFGAQAGLYTKLTITLIMKTKGFIKPQVFLKCDFLFWLWLERRKQMQGKAEGKVKRQAKRSLTQKSDTAFRGS
jgi:hypothetical protein